MAQTLSVEGLTVAARKGNHDLVLVREVSLQLRSGEVLALVGGSGSGKSMTCAGLQNVLPPGVRRTSGIVRIDGKEIDPVALRGRTIATVMQNPRSAFNPVHKIKDHAREVLRVNGTASERDPDVIRDVFIEVGLEEPERIADLYPFEMSGGMLQRAMIALALLSRAPFLLADEPTTDLDLVVQSRILDLLLRLRDTRGLGILLVTHDLGVVAKLADRVAVMANGCIVEEAPIAEIFAAPSHPHTRELLAAHLMLYERVAA
jgi:nickel transport system ATP-binding protein